MQPLFNSPNALPQFPEIENEQDSAEPDLVQRETFMGRELPTADQILQKTSQEFYDSLDKIDIHNNCYLHYMLLGIHPHGPYDESTEGIENRSILAVLIRELISNRQFTALNELIQRCGSLTEIRVDLRDFSVDLLKKFLANVNAYQPELPSMTISGFPSVDSQEGIDLKASALADFIACSTKLKSFCVFGLSSDFSLPLINALSEANHLESLQFGPYAVFSDDAFDKLSHLIRNKPELKSITFLRGVRDEHLLQILLALQCCPHLEVLHLKDCSAYGKETTDQLRQLIGKSSTLKHCSFSIAEDHVVRKCLPFIQAIATGLAENRSLYSVSLDFDENWNVELGALSDLIKAAIPHPCIQRLIFSPQYCYQLDITRALADLIEMNRNVIDVGVELSLLKKLPREFQDKLRNVWISADPWSDHVLRASSHDEELKKLCGLIEDRVARNKAIAGGEIARNFGQAFFSSSGTLPGTNHIADPGLVLSEHILSLSPGLSNFQNTMVEIALTVDETARLEQENKKKREPEETTNDQTIALRNTTRDETKPGTQS